MQKDIIQKIDLLVEMSDTNSVYDSLREELRIVELDIAKLKDAIHDLTKSMVDTKYMRASDRIIDENIKISLENKLSNYHVTLKEIEKKMLYDEIENGRVSIKTSRFFRKVKPDVVKLIDSELFDIFDLNHSSIEIPEEYEDVTESMLIDFIKEKTEETLSQNYLNISTYKKINIISFFDNFPCIFSPFICFFYKEI